MSLTAAQRRTGWLLLLVSFFALRLGLPLVLRPVGYIADWNDYFFFEDWARFTDRGLYPYLDFWMEHPPLFPWLVVGVYRLSALVPVWDNPRFGFTLVFSTVLLLFELGNLLLIGRLATRVAGPDRGLLAGWLWALLFPPVFYWAAGFEGYPLFFLLLSLLLAVVALERGSSGWAVLAGLAAGVGVMVKVIPGVVAPVAALALWRQGQRRAALLLAGGTLLAAGLIALPFALANPTMARASVMSILARGSWETVWALAEGYYSGGAVAQPETRLDPATAVGDDRSAPPATVLALALAGMVGGAALLGVRRWQPRALVAAGGLALSLFFLVAKGYSPQFLVYLLAPVVVLWPGARGIGYALLLSGVNLVEYPLALLLFADQPAVLGAAVLARMLLLLALVVEYSCVLFGRPSPFPARLALPAGVALAVLLSGVVLSATVTAATTRLPTESAAAAVTFLHAHQGTALFSDRGLYDRLTPLLRGSLATRLVLPDLPPRLPQGDIWEVYIDSEEGRRTAPGVRAVLAQERFPAESEVLAGLRLTRFAALPVPPVRALAGDLGAVRLSGGAFPEITRAGALVPVVLEWQVVTPLSAELSVFLHVVDGQGRIVAQRDAPPLAGTRPTTSWQPGETVRDRQSIPLPADRAGRFRLLAGLYQPASGQRLAGPAGDSLELGTLEVIAG
ncbi:MAG: hypothetical protein KatS3mg061_0305 [Dehalococcoidia bacterium]|nr:MAG: hypothetical protein KatS3mg061_0305 [Dehalococcoidia bacterium]